jgi:RNA recognition motif-containing protein
MSKEQRRKYLERQLKKQNLFVQNIPEDVTEDRELKEFFEKFGRVKNAKVITKQIGTDESGKPLFIGQGKGFVCFET